LGVYYAGMPSPVEGCRRKNLGVRVTGGGGEVLTVGKARWVDAETVDRLLANLRKSGKANGNTVVACERMGSELTCGVCGNIYCELHS